MKRFITMILAIAMVITSVIVPTDKVSAAVGDYVWECNGKESDGSYCIYKLRIVDYYADGTPMTDINAVAKAYYDANDNMIGLFENGVWTKCVAVDSDILPLDCYGRCWTIDDDGTWKEWDTDGNLIYQSNPGGKVVINKRMIENIIVDDGDKKDYHIFVGEEKGNVDTFMVTEGFTSKKKLRCRGDGAVLNVKWSSSNPSIAAVSETGIVTGKKAGKATLTATVIASGQQVKVPVKIVKNKCYGTRDFEGTKVSGSISYDKKSNLVCKFKIKNTTKKKLKYKRKDNKLSFTISDGKHKNKSTSKRFGFTLKRGKSKTVTITIKKSKLKAKYNLPESHIKARMFINNQCVSTLAHMGLTVDGE